MLPIMTMTLEEYDRLPKWDGRSQSGRRYDIEQVDYWDMRKDPTDGSILYLTFDKPRRVNVWCSASQLDAHLHHLEQIKARR